MHSHTKRNSNIHLIDDGESQIHNLEVFVKAVIYNFVSSSITLFILCTRYNCNMTIHGQYPSMISLFLFNNLTVPKLKPQTREQKKCFMPYILWSNYCWLKFIYSFWAKIIVGWIFGQLKNVTISIQTIPPKYKEY